MAKKKMSGGDIFKRALSIVTLVLVAIIVYAAREELWEAIGYIRNLNGWVLLLLIPEQLMMYFAAGQIYISYLRDKFNVKISAWKSTRISLEMNFMNHVVPSGGVSGLGYLAWRLREYKITGGQATFMQILRMGVASVVNVVQMLLAVFIIWGMGVVAPEDSWILWAGVIWCVGGLGIVAVAWLIIQSKKRIDQFAGLTDKFVNGFVKWVTRGKRRKIIRQEKIEKFFGDIHDDMNEMKKSKKLLFKPLIWAVVYNFFEAITYFIVACALGHPGVWPQMLLAEGLASFVGTVVATPGGVGGYEASFIAIMVMTGVDLGVATVMVVVTRVIVLLSTIVFGWGFYQHALMSRGGKPKEIKGVDVEF